MSVAILLLSFIADPAVQAHIDCKIELAVLLDADRTVFTVYEPIMVSSIATVRHSGACTVHCDIQVDELVVSVVDSSGRISSPMSGQFRKDERETTAILAGRQVLASSWTCLQLESSMTRSCGSYTVNSTLRYKMDGISRELVSAGIQVDVLLELGKERGILDWLELREGVKLDGLSWIDYSRLVFRHLEEMQTIDESSAILQAFRYSQIYSELRDLGPEDAGFVEAIMWGFLLPIEYRDDVLFILTESSKSFPCISVPGPTNLPSRLGKCSGGQKVILLGLDRSAVPPNDGMSRPSQ